MPSKQKIQNPEEIHRGYNEKNPAQPQGAFAADSVQSKSSKTVVKKVAKKGPANSSKKVQ